MRFYLLLIGTLAFGCGKASTGSGLVSFQTTAAGAKGAAQSGLAFTTGSGAQVTLTQAKLHIGAVYLNQSVPLSGAASQPCVSPGVYVAEAFGPVDVDLLSTTPVTFPIAGAGTVTEAKTAEVWLTGGDINATSDSTVILQVSGTAVQQSVTYPFSSSITISSNRLPTVSNPALPGANPICHQRIVTPISIDLTPRDGGTLGLTIDPRPMFNAVDFSKATKSTGTPATYQIDDNSSGAGQSLYKGLISNSGVYLFSWH